MVKALAERLKRNPLPARCVVARLASLREAAVMRVFVAVGALAEGNARVLRLAVGAIDVALRALHLNVEPGQRIASLGVIELFDLHTLPILDVMALLAGLTKPALVRILVTNGARWGQTEVGAAQVLHLDCRTVLLGDVGRIVAFAASYTRVFAFKQVAGLFMVKGPNVPFDQWKIFAVVFRVAAGAFFAGT